jgi:hypothetical protein
MNIIPTPLEAAQHVVERMVKCGYMSGCLGDDSEDFKAEQAQGLLSMSKRNLEQWFANSETNMRDARVSYIAVAVLLNR